MLDIDSTAMHVLQEIMSELNRSQVQLFFACMKGPIRDAFKRFGVVVEVGQNHFFWSVHDAVVLYYASVLKEPPPNIEEEIKHSHIQMMQPEEASNASVLPEELIPEYSPFMFEMEEMEMKAV